VAQVLDLQHDLAVRLLQFNDRAFAAGVVFYVGEALLHDAKQGGFEVPW